MVVIGILSTLAIGVVPDALAQGRDKERISDIDTLHNKLEEYFTNNGGYPSTLSGSLKKLDDETLLDPSRQMITIQPSTASFFEAMNTPTPTASTASQYSYSAYPAGCGVTSPCSGYVLKSFIEKPTDKVPNPYVKTGINNN